LLRRITAEGTPHMAGKLIIVMANTDPRKRRGTRCTDLPGHRRRGDGVRSGRDLHGHLGRLMKKGVAESLVVKEGSPKTVYDFIKTRTRRA